MHFMVMMRRERERDRDRDYRMGGRSRSRGMTGGGGGGGGNGVASTAAARAVARAALQAEVREMLAQAMEAGARSASLQQQQQQQLQSEAADDGKMESPDDIPVDSAYVSVFVPPSTAAAAAAGPTSDEPPTSHEAIAGEPQHHHDPPLDSQSPPDPELVRAFEQELHEPPPTSPTHQEPSHFDLVDNAFAAGTFRQLDVHTAAAIASYHWAVSRITAAFSTSQEGLLNLKPRVRDHAPQCLTAAGVATILSALYTFDHPTVLAFNLEGNSLGPEGARILQDGLARLPVLLSLNLSENAFGPLGADYIQNGLAHAPALRVLHMAANELGPLGMARLCAGFVHVPNLIDLDISQNGIGPDGTAVLQEGLSALTNLCSLKMSGIVATTSVGSVSLMACDADNAVSDLGCHSLAQGIRHTTQLTLLDLAANHVTAVGLTALQSGLLACAHLTHLDLSHNQFDTDDAGVQLVTAFHGLPHLSVLRLKSCQLTPHAVTLVAQGVGALTKLEALRLADNLVHAPAAGYLLRSFGSLPALAKLEFVLFPSGDPLTFTHTPTQPDILHKRYVDGTTLAFKSSQVTVDPGAIDVLQVPTTIEPPIPPCSAAWLLLLAALCIGHTVLVIIAILGLLTHNTVAGAAVSIAFLAAAILLQALLAAYKDCRANIAVWHLVGVGSLVELLSTYWRPAVPTSLNVLEPTTELPSRGLGAVLKACERHGMFAAYPQFLILLFCTIKFTGANMSGGIAVLLSLFGAAIASGTQDVRARRRNVDSRVSRLAVGTMTLHVDWIAYRACTLAARTLCFGMFVVNITNFWLLLLFMLLLHGVIVLKHARADMPWSHAVLFSAWYIIHAPGPAEVRPAWSVERHEWWAISSRLSLYNTLARGACMVILLIQWTGESFWLAIGAALAGIDVCLLVGTHGFELFSHGIL